MGKLNLSKDQEYELLASISARGQIPIKYAFSTESGAAAWDKIYKTWDSSSSGTSDDLRLIQYRIDDLLRPFSQEKGVNIIDLGCGNGLPALFILQEASKRGLALTYTGVDISREMLSLAEKNIKKGFPEVNISTKLVDYEKESLIQPILGIKKRNNYPNLLLNLGNTIGIHVNPQAVLDNFLQSMSFSDYLIIGNGLSNTFNPDWIIKQYDIKLIRDFVTKPAKDLNIFTSKDKFEYRWNNQRKTLEGRVAVQTRKSLQLAGQSFDIEKGESILVHESRKYSDTSFLKMLSDAGFRTEILTTSKSRNYAIVMVQPTRFGTI